MREYPDMSSHCLLAQRGKEKKKSISSTPYRAEFHQLLNVTGQSWIPPSHSLAWPELATNWQSSQSLLEIRTRRDAHNRDPANYQMAGLPRMELCGTGTAEWTTPWTCSQESFLNSPVRVLFTPTLEWKHRKQRRKCNGIDKWLHFRIISRKTFSHDLYCSFIIKYFFCNYLHQD